MDIRTISATPASFQGQMQHVAKYYCAVSMSQVLDAVEGKTQLPERAVLITFDDAYTDFAEIALPILKQYRLPATMFVPTAYPGQPGMTFWWDRLYQAIASTRLKMLRQTPLGVLSFLTPKERGRSLSKLQKYITTIPADDATRLVDSICGQLCETLPHCVNVLSWDQLRQLAKEGVTLGSHSRTHSILTQLSADRIREEIRSSQRDLNEEIGFALPILCYPGGFYNDRVISILREEGIVLGFGVLAGINELDSMNLLSLNRTTVYPRTSLSIFRLRLRRLGIHLDAYRSYRLKLLWT